MPARASWRSVPESCWRPSRWSTAAWILYDLANTTFALGVTGRYFAPWAIERAGASDAAVAVAAVSAAVAAAVIAPWYGAVSDRIGRRRPLLVAATMTTVCATALLASGGLAQSLALYVVAMAGFHLGSVVYDAMLPDVSTPESRGRVSGLGVSVGYLGSLLALGLGTLLLEPFGYRVLFQALALAFLVFALPAFFLIDERPRTPADGRVRVRPKAVVKSFVDAWRVAARARGVVRFLIGRYVYSDAINTFFLFNVVYLRVQLGFTDRQTDAAVLAGIIAAIISAAGSGWLVDRYGPRRVLHAALGAVISAAALAVAVGVGAPKGLSYLVASLGGAGIGAIWVSDRVYMARISPPEHLGQLFGLHATVGRFAVLIGPVLWSLGAALGASGRVVSMATVGLLLVIARAVLTGVDDAPRSWEVAGAAPGRSDPG